MPARSAYTICARPLGIIRLSGFGGLPQHKVEWVLFTVIYGYTFPSLQLVQRFTGELTVARKFTHREVHVAIACLVG